MIVVTLGDVLVKCNGIELGDDLTAKERQAITDAYENALAKFVEYANSPTCTHKFDLSWRYPSLQAVFDRLMSFQILGYHSVYGSPEEWVLDALRDFCEANYWYANHKEW